jgi:hypothetical protein
VGSSRCIPASDGVLLALSGHFLNDTRNEQGFRGKEDSQWAVCEQMQAVVMGNQKGRRGDLGLRGS